MLIDTETSENLTEQNTGEQLMLFQADSLVSLSVLPGSKEAQKITDTSGQKCLESFQRLGRASLLAKTFLELSPFRSTRCYLTWKLLATPQKRLLFRLVPSTPHTEEIESGLLATPNTLDSMEPKTEKAVIKEATETRLGRTKFANLRDQLYHGMLLPTPTTDSVSNRKKKYKHGGMPLTTFIGMLPTPKNRDWKGNSQRGIHQPMDAVPNMISTQPGLKLHPNFVEWMMGYPIGWTELKD